MSSDSASISTSSPVAHVIQASSAAVLWTRRIHSSRLGDHVAQVSHVIAHRLSNLREGQGHVIQTSSAAALRTRQIRSKHLGEHVAQASHVIANRPFNLRESLPQGHVIQTSSAAVLQTR